VGLACLPRFLGDRAPGLRRLEPPVAEPVRALWLGMHRDARTTPRVRAVFVALEDALRKLGTTLCPT
jgi:DNA-binding transcriptional LysR family regulator